MSSVSFPLFVSVQSGNPRATIRVSTSYRDESLEIEGTAVNPFFQPDSELDPPDVGVPGPGETSQPPYFGAGTGLFNHLLLPKLTNFPSKVFNLGIDGVELFINGVDFSGTVYSLDWSVPVNGVSQGSLTLRQAVGFNIDPDTNGITQGSTVQISIRPTKLYSELLTNCFVIGNPTYTLNQDGEYELGLEIGDELALLSESARNRTLYCGLPARTTQELATIYANTNGLRTRVFPVGHAIQEASTNNFLTESPFEFLSSIYGPINRDVRCSPRGAIVFPVRRDFDLSLATVLSYRDVIESSNNFSGYYEPFTKVKVSNNFDLLLPFEFSNRATRQIQGNPENKKPWFQGGYQEIVTTSTSLGDTDVYIREDTYGYVPTEARPWDKALVDEDPCAIGAFTTAFQLIGTKIKALSYYAHPSGSKIVSRVQTWVNGLQIYQITDEGSPNFEDYDLFNGLISYENVTYVNSPQPNVDVCSKDWQIVQTNVRREDYKLSEDRILFFSGWVQENYSPSGTSSLLGQSSFTGVDQTWIQTLDQGEYDEAGGFWVIQPTQTEVGVNPPGATIISPVTQNITNFSELTLSEFQELEPIPLNAPFCYNKDQLDTFAFRYLTEQYGMSKSIMVTVPFSNTLGLGDSVVFEDRNGIRKNFRVWRIEVNLTGKQITKSLVLLRWN